MIKNVFEIHYFLQLFEVLMFCFKTHGPQVDQRTKKKNNFRKVDKVMLFRGERLDSDMTNPEDLFHVSS